MKKRILTSIVLIIALALMSHDAPAQGESVSAEEKAAARAFLKDVYTRYHLPYQGGLKSFDLRVRVRESSDPAVKKILDTLSIEYGFEAPGTEKIHMSGIMDLLQKFFREFLKGIWKDIAGGGLFPDIEEREIHAVIPGDEQIVIELRAQGEPWGKVLLDAKTLVLLRLERGGEGIVHAIVPEFTLHDGRLRLEAKNRLLSQEGGEEELEISYRYAAFREINGFTLPTKLAIESREDRTELQLEYVRVNGEDAVYAQMDPEEIKALVKEYEKNYSKKTAPEKLEALKRLEETGHDLAAKAIAKRGLKDRDLEVRKESVKALGAMKCRCAVSSLIKAMKPNEKELDVYLDIIRALGNIGDPKAIPSLSKDFWNQKKDGAIVEAAQAKIDALGEIRSRKSVEALIDMLYVAQSWAMASVAANLRAALKKLTGQDFGYEREEWKDWWKKNKSKFRLEED